MKSFSQLVQDHFIKKTRELFRPTQGLVWNQTQFWCLIVYEGHLCQLTSQVVQISQTLGWNQYAVE